MGAWGSGSFDNDDAMDWLQDLARSTDESAIVRALDAVLGDGYVEAPDASIALAAAEVVAAAVDHPAADLPPEVTAWIQAQENAPDRGSAVTAGTAAKAYRTVERIATGSELKELWDDSDSTEEWRAAVVDLQRRLAGAVADPANLPSPN